MRERSTMYATGAGRSALLEADRGGAWLRPLFVVLAAITLALAATMLVRPGVALAAPSPLTDDTTADFGAGTPDANTRVGDGEVALEPTVEVDEDFSGTSLPAGWTVTKTWQAGGSATVADGQLTVDGAQVQTGDAYGPGRALEFTATFGAREYQSLGFATDLEDIAGQSWAQFGTNNTANSLWARTNVNGTAVNFQIPDSGQYIGTPHTYRIEWATDGLRYFIDGALVHTEAVAPTANMPLVASDYLSGAPNLSVSDFTLTSYPASGQFISRILEADGTADWQQLTSMVEPSGADVTFETRSGNTSEEITGSAWQPVAPDGTVASPNGRYIQYRATLNSEDPFANSPAVEQVSISYDLVDGTKPTIEPKKPRGKTTDRTPKVVAVVRDGQSELSKDDIQLFLDGKEKTSFSYNAETDKITYNSKRLSYGSHTVRIEAEDEAGNEASKGWRFKIVKKR
jgi:hypothetical protein